MRIKAVIDKTCIRIANWTPNSANANKIVKGGVVGLPIVLITIIERLGTGLTYAPEYLIADLAIGSGLAFLLSRRIDHAVERESTAKNILSLHQKLTTYQDIFQNKTRTLKVHYKSKTSEKVYHLSEQFQEGGQAQVRRVTNLTDDRPEIMKVMHKSFAQDTNFIKRFKQEIEILEALRHPNVIQVYGHGEINGRLFYTMQSIDGPNLEELLFTTDRLPLLKAAKLMRRIAQTIHDLHKVGIIHRDLKPSNILITKDNQPIIIDLGLARDNTVDHRLTQTGVLGVGTPEYMPREQHLAENIDERTDIYAEGATFFELISGRPPYPWDRESESIQNYIRRMSEIWQSEEIPDIRRCIPNINREELKDAFDLLQSIFIRTLHVNRDYRYPNNSKFMEDLEHLIKILENYESTKLHQNPYNNGV